MPRVTNVWIRMFRTAFIVIDNGIQFPLFRRALARFSRCRFRGGGGGRGASSFPGPAARNAPVSPAPEGRTTGWVFLLGVNHKNHRFGGFCGFRPRGRPAWRLLFRASGRRGRCNVRAGSILLPGGKFQGSCGPMNPGVVLWRGLIIPKKYRTPIDGRDRRLSSTAGRTNSRLPHHRGG